MKKLLFSAVALATLLFASCQQEKLESAQGGNLVTFTVEAPATALTKAIGDGTNVDQLIYEVWMTKEYGKLTSGAQKLYQGQPVRMEVVDGVAKATITLDLVNDQKFTVLFWAQNDAADAYSTAELTAVTYAKTEYLANDESLAAFYGVAYVNDSKHVNKDGSAKTDNKVVLRRPFAQVNIGTLNTASEYDVVLSQSQVTLSDVPTVFNVVNSEVSDEVSMTFKLNAVPNDPEILKVNDTDYQWAAMNYVFAGSNITVAYDIETKVQSLGNETIVHVTHEIDQVPVKENYRTNIIGNLLSSNVEFEIVVDASWEAEYIVEDGNINTNTYVTNASEFAEAFVAAFEGEANNNVITLDGDISLNDILTRATADPSYTLPKDKTLTIDLNGKKLTATSSQVGTNYNMFKVHGEMTIKNGTIEYKHEGDNMGWSQSTNIFHVEEGVLNLSGVTAKNLGGSDMGFVVHLNNWSYAPLYLNVENSTLESNYVPVRVFNSGPCMNNVDIKNTTLNGGSAAFWVHNYTVADFGSEEKAESQKALLNLNIYNQGNTFSPDVNGIRYGFTDAIRSDACGITKVVSEDGATVTLGSVVENGLIRRGVAGAEENTTITKAVVEEGVAVLYDRTFRRFYALETVELPSTLTTIGAAGSGVFQSCNNLKNIVIPESVTVLGAGTFQECSSLETINIPAGVTRIEENCLRNTGLKSVEFHAGVTYFGAQAFRDCKQLKEVIINAPKFTVEANAFGIMSGSLPGTIVYVANEEMKEYLEKTLAYANQLTIIAGKFDNYCDKDVTNKEGVLYEGDVFESGQMDNTLWLNSYYFDGNAAIKVVDKAYKAIVIENCAGNFRNDAITIDNDNNSVMILQNLNFSLEDGKKLIKSVNPIYQVFIANVTINGELVTQETVASYLENVAWYQVVEEI